MLRVGVVGAGIAGLAHAYLLKRAGAEVTVFERDAFAVGASVRNFGMIWPVGQAPEVKPLALRSSELWLEASKEAGFEARQSGSLHAVHHPLEMQVLREFASMHPDVEILTPQQTLERCSLVRDKDLEGGMFSSTELCVDPRTTVSHLAAYLEREGVSFRWSTPIAKVAPNEITPIGEETRRFDLVISALGPEMSATDPAHWAESGMRRCRLQMMRFRPKTEARAGVHLAFGLTLGHYAGFATCPSLPSVRELHLARWPEQIEHGIHILISEHSDGTITVGDSHEYGDTVVPYRRESVDEAILAATRTFFRLEEYEILERWEGVYPTHSDLPYYLNHVPGLTAVNLFGTGMTLSFGVAELTVNRYT